MAVIPSQCSCERSVSYSRGNPAGPSSRRARWRSPRRWHPRRTSDREIDHGQPAIVSNSPASRSIATIPPIQCWVAWPRAEVFSDPASIVGSGAHLSFLGLRVLASNSNRATDFRYLTDVIALTQIKASSDHRCETAIRMRSACWRSTQNAQLVAMRTPRPFIWRGQFRLGDTRCHQPPREHGLRYGTRSFDTGIGLREMRPRGESGKIVWLPVAADWMLSHLLG
jgi:hypothetical protein